MALYLGHKGLYQPYGELVDAVVVVAVFGVVALYPEVGDDAVLVADGVNLCILYCRERIGRARKSRNASCEEAVHLCVVQGHLERLVAVFIVHVVNDVERVHIQPCQPVHHLFELCHYVVKVERPVAEHGHEAGRNLEGLARGLVL